MWGFYSQVTIVPTSSVKNFVTVISSIIPTDLDFTPTRMDAHEKIYSVFADVAHGTKTPLFPVILETYPIHHSVKRTYAI